MSLPTYTVERRAVARRPCERSYCRLLEGVPRDAELRDISSRGLGLLCEAPVRPGEFVNLHLRGSHTRLGLGLRARVVHSEQRPDGRWIAGCAFDQTLPDALVALLR